MRSNYAYHRILQLVLAALLVLPPFAWAQKPASTKGDIAIAVYQPTQMSWEPQIAYASVSLRVVGPGGFLHDQNFDTGKPAFNLAGTPGDGRYNYELIFGRIPDARLKAAFAGGEFGEDGSAADRRLIASVAALQATYSGSFLVVAGEIVRPDLKELPLQPGLNSAKAPGGTVGGPKDVVTADDAIIQGSLCAGLDCVNNESFGFDTIRLKENNTRISFNDTSVPPFPTNDWTIRANSSASGGESFLGFVDRGASNPADETGTIVFSVAAGAPANSIKVDSAGRVGFRTSTPVLDLHTNTGNTPAIRLEQNSSGGFTAQTWDIAGNEANFFVRDVTGGSRLPLRIRPGAPTSSIDIAASGNVGIGTSSPGAKLTVSGGSIRLDNNQPIQALDSIGGLHNLLTLLNTNDTKLNAYVGQGITFTIANTEKMRLDSNGNVGIGTTPAAQLHTTGSVRFAGVANCSSGIVSNANGDLSCLVSSRQFKNVEGDLGPMAALANVMALRPQVGSYKATPDEPEHWLIAEEVAAVDPALVGMRNGEPYTVKTQGVVADLVAVIQEQQRRIEALERAIAKY